MLPLAAKELSNKEAENDLQTLDPAPQRLAFNASRRRINIKVMEEPGEIRISEHKRQHRRQQRRSNGSNGSNLPN